MFKLFCEALPSTEYTIIPKTLCVGGISKSAWYVFHTLIIKFLFEIQLLAKYKSNLHEYLLPAVAYYSELNINGICRNYKVYFTMFNIYDGAIITTFTLKRLKFVSIIQSFSRHISLKHNTLIHTTVL